MKASFLTAILFLSASAGLSGMALANTSTITATDSEPDRATARSTTLPAALRPALYYSLAQDTGPSYNVNEAGCAVLSKLTFKACFKSQGAYFSDANSATLTLRAVAYGRGTRLTRLGPVSPEIEGNQVRYPHGSLTEWWRVLPIGFEQGFTITRPPIGTGKLKLVLADNRPPEHKGSALSWGRLRYGRLVVTDATDKVIPATLNVDGNRVLIAVNDAHASYPLTVDPLVWLEQKVTASDGATNGFFGYSVAIDGTTALVGAKEAVINGHLGQGAVYVFNESNGTWTQTAKFTSSDGAAYDQFGQAVALDGTTALVGAANAAVNGKGAQGKAYVFTESDGTWKQTAKLIASDGTKFDLFGAAVALDGTTALIGAYQAPFNGNIYDRRGAAYVFSESNGTWTQTAKLVASDGTSQSVFGYSVALHGATALVGSPQATVNGNRSQGAAYVFSETNGAWTQAAKLIASDGTRSSFFGYSVALDDTTALVGAYGTTVNGKRSQGAAYVFSGSGSNWTRTAKLTARDGTTSDNFGFRVALAGTTALIGAEGATVNGNTRQGAAYVFSESNGTWTQTTKLLASNGAAADLFGYSVALDGTTALVGADDATLNGNRFQGEAYFYGGSDLGLAINAPRRVNPGNDFTASTIVTNNASATSAAAVAVSIAVPAAASFLSATATQGGCSETSRIVRCAFGAIPGNAGVAKADISLKTIGQGGSAITNRAEISHATPPLTTTASTAVNHLPVADDGRLVVADDKPTIGTLKASDADGDPLVFNIVTPPKHGSITINDVHKGVFTYTPDSGYVGADDFSFQVNDGYADSNIATVIVSMVNQPPVAHDATLTTKENTAVKGALQASDPNGDRLSFAIVAPPSHGSVTLDASTGDFTYTPNSDYFGTDSFTFKANDGQSDSNIATVNVTVEGSAPPPPPPNNGGSGSFGTFLLMFLAVLAATTILLRRIGRGARKPGAALNARKGQLGTKRKETNMRIHTKWTTAVGLLALVAIVGASFTPISSVAQSNAATTLLHKSSGLTRQGIKVANQSGLPSHLVTMAPQSSLKLLSRATKLGPHTAGSTIKLTVALKLRNEAKLKSFLEQVQNPHSPLYHQWLTPAEFTRLYGPTKAEVAQVVAFLKAHGIKVKDVSSNHMLIHTAATTRVYEHALGIRINDYKLDGRHFYSTGDAPKLPRAIAPRVVNILGLNHGVQMHPISLFQRPLTDARGLSPLQRPPASLTNLNPLQIAHAYNYPDITDASYGAGVNVAVLTAASSGLANLSDPHDFWAAFGLPNHTVNVIPVDGDKGDTSGMNETLLDVEYSGAMGPGATLNVYVAATPALDTMTDMYNQFANDTNPDGSAKNHVMTTSWGAPETLGGDKDIVDDQIFMQAASEGISMFAATGDHGSSDGTAQDDVANYPSSSLYITAANGTQLNISDLSGDYGSEVVWNDVNCFGNGPFSTGGAVSQQFDRPAWQVGPGVPADIDMRMNSDMAATASCTKPMLILNNGQWLLTGGTSAVAPQFAGLFAIAVAENDGPLGQSNKLIYNDVNAGNEASDFHDVTEGNNGAFEAGPNWDHPTGWGSPNAKNLLSHLGIQGLKGTLRGTVTDASSGQTVAGARIVAGKRSVLSQDNGTYSMMLPVGNYNVTVSDFGRTDGVASVSITNGNITTQNFALQAAPQVTLSGKVTDDSGHGYGLYAEIKISAETFGQVVADVWTDPATGKYSVKLPKGFDYTLRVAAAFDGYTTASATIILSGNKTKNFALAIGPTCTAPGYVFAIGGLGQDFNGDTFPPAGWKVTNPVNGRVVWIPSSQQPARDSGNFTGGTGDAASADSNAHNGFFGGLRPYDTSLVTPPIPVTSLHGATILKYKANYQRIRQSPTGAFDLGISTDGGAGWTKVLHWTSNHGTLFGTPGADVRVKLAPYLPSSGNFQLRWRYYNLSSGFHSWNGYAQIDDVSIGVCKAVAGGLVFGQVTDANTGDGITWAKVAGDLGNKVYTTTNPDDSAFPIGGYLLFVPAGKRTLTASYYRYQNGTSSFTMNNNAIKRLDFVLNAGQFEGDPNAFSLHAMVNNHVTRTFTVNNTGSGKAHFSILPVNAPPPAKTRGPGASLITIKGDFSPLRITASQIGHSVQTNARPAANAAPWVTVASYPVPVMDNGMALDPTTNVVYSVDGINSNGYLNAVYTYNPVMNTWKLTSHNTIAREAPQVVFIGDRLYVVGGWNSTGKTVPQLDIYNPITGKWTKGASIPSAYAGAGHAIVNGKLYVVGGCADDCLSANVEVYNPVINTWSQARDYPHPVAWESCGGIAGKLYCTGGTSGTSTFYKDGYVYDPGTNHWSPIRDMPIYLWGSGYAAANGLLLVSAGVSGSQGNKLTNASYAYNPATNRWHNIPNSSYPLFRGGSVCGFYKVGGSQNLSAPLTPLTPVMNAERLLGYAQCGTPMPIPWLVPTPAGGTIAAGAATKVTLIFDGTGQKEYTTSHAYLKLQGNVPYPDQVVPLTVTWDPQPVNLVLSGNVNPSSVRKGNNLAYTVSVTNRQANNHGAATEVILSYPVPQGVTYQAASGDASCTASPTGGTSSAPTAASGGSTSGAVTCDFGTIALGDSKTETLAVKTTEAGKLTSTFDVSAREPESDSGDNHLSLTSEVIGTADLALTADSASITAGDTGKLTLTLKNNGPDPASEVQIHAAAGGQAASLQSASTSQGSCAVNGDALTCDLGQVNTDDTVTVAMTFSGDSAGTTSVNAQASTASNEPNPANNGVTATVTVKAPPPPDNSGSGTLGWIALVMLLGLAGAASYVRRKQQAVR